MKAAKHILALVLFWMLIGTLVLSCSKDNANGNSRGSNGMKVSEVNTDEFNLAVFERNRDLWTSKNIQHYKMIIGASGFLMNFPEKVLIEVRNSRPVSTYSLSKTGNNATNSYKGYDTVEHLFSFIETEKKRNAKRLDVIYDVSLGFPRQIRVDQDENVSDDELSLAVEKLEILN